MTPAGDSSRVESSLAEMVASSSLEDWSTAAIELSTSAVADTFAIGLSGMTQEQTCQALSTVSPYEGENSAPLWSSATRYPIGDAAFIGGVACHALDWDDYMHPMHGHCSAVLLPTAWSLVESRQGSGRDLIEAFVVGYQVDYLVSRILGSAHYERGWHATSTVGVLGAAAAAACLLRLDERQTASALAIAASLACGLRANFGTSTKALHAGFAARHGVQSVQLALSGATGSSHWLLGPHGMLETFGGELGRDDAAETLLGDLEGRHGIETDWGLVQKPYACCGSCHSAVDALIELSKRFGEAPESIEEIEIHVDPLVPNIMHEQATSPSSARYCLPWVAAVAVTDLAAGPEQFSRTALERTDVHRLSERVRVVPDLRVTDDNRFSARVVLKGGGSVFEQTITHATGHPLNPMSRQRLAMKQYAALEPRVGAATARTLVDGVAEILSLPDLSRLGDAARNAFSG